MQRKTILGFTAALACATALVGVPMASAENGTEGGSESLEAIGLTTSQRLVRFDVDNPGRTLTIGAVSGLAGDNRLVGIDYRVQNNRLYGVGNAGGVYTLNESDASATKVSQITVALTGKFFGVDFNPAADRLRVISDTGQNLRHDVNPGGLTTVDLGLTYPPATTPATGLTAAAYTNNDLDPNTATTLYYIDTSLNQLAIQSPANNGTLAPTGLLTVNPAPLAGFDIYSEVDDGTTVDLEAYATLRVGFTYRVYEITLFSGNAEDNGGFPAGMRVMDLAMPLNQL